MIYILKFSKPLGNPANPRGTAQYYIGYCSDKEGGLERRLKTHRAGRGASITRAANERGITYEVVLTLPGFYDEEKRIKAYKNTRKFVERELARRAQIGGQSCQCS